MKAAVIPGSFDPFTNGHLDIVQRALEVVDQVTVAVLNNTSKKNLFTPDERVEIIQEIFAKDKRVKVETFSGLLVDYCRKSNVNIIIRGLRAVSDFEYEHAIYLMNNKMLAELETIFLMSRSENSFISSSIVKEVASLGGDVNDQVPELVAKRLKEIFTK